MWNGIGSLGATLLVVIITGSHAFAPMTATAPSCVGGSSFAHSMRVVGAPVSARSAVRPAVLELKASEYARLKNGALIGKIIPGNWKQGQDYDFNVKASRRQGRRAAASGLAAAASC
ncbi:hypothetical protein T484DRAFT_2940511 [Baffinella frigidus]|nr:hypothetical protein T484DRAFT_2940511 [Cryptophyta sp. CCMP2293]